MPHHLALTVAAYLCCIAPPTGFDPGPHAAAMADPARAGLVADGRPHPSVRDFVTAVLGRRPARRPDLAEHPEFIERVAEFIDIIVRARPGRRRRTPRQAADPRRRC